MAELTKEETDEILKTAKVLTKDGAYWSNLKDKILADTENMKKAVALNDHIIPFVDSQIDKAKSE